MKTTCETHLDHLSELASRMSDEFDKKHAICAETIRQAFRHFVWVLDNIVVMKGRRHISIAALASRVLEHAHAAYNLIRAGDAASATVVMRAMLESIYSIGALVRDENFVDDKDMFLRLRYKAAHANARSIRKFLAEASISPSDRAHMEKKLAEHEGFMKANAAHKLTTVGEVVEAAQMETFHSREYAFQCKTAHADLDWIVDSHVKESADTFIVMGAQANHDAVYELSAQLANSLMYAATIIGNFFKLAPTEDELARRAGIDRDLAKPFALAAEG